MSLKGKTAIAGLGQTRQGKVYDRSYMGFAVEAVENGLGFGTKALFDDPDVQAAFAKWIDIDIWVEQLDLARAQRHTPWQGIWNEFFRLEHVRATAGETDVDTALAAATAKWTELQQQFGG